MFKGAEITFWSARIVLVGTNFIGPLLKICFDTFVF